ncbi:hypothetical protein EV359DRAFT_85954 [Lentinula novae-zelandiae]|nr:hypothetical protein EV359DRAFT_85954 [Lentinula novae-zelandiae]
MKFFVTVGFLLIAMNAVLSVNALFTSPAEKACGHFGSSHNNKACSYVVKTKNGRMTVNGTCSKRSGIHVLRHYTCVPAGATNANANGSSTAASATATASPASATVASTDTSSADTSGDSSSAGAAGSMRRRRRHWSSREPRGQEDMVAN